MDPKVELLSSELADPKAATVAPYNILQTRSPWLYHSPLALPQQIPPGQCPSLHDAELEEQYFVSESLQDKCYKCQEVILTPPTHSDMIPFSTSTQLLKQRRVTEDD